MSRSILSKHYIEFTSIPDHGNKCHVTCHFHNIFNMTHIKNTTSTKIAVFLYNSFSTQPVYTGVFLKFSAYNSSTFTDFNLLILNY